jgi:hypothetical protein
MRNAGINDTFEGTQQMDQTIVARRIPDCSPSTLRGGKSCL